MRLFRVAFCLSASAIPLAVACPSLAAQTSEFFQARILPRDRSVNVQLVSNKTIEWKITAEGNPVTLNNGELLLTYSGFKIGFLHYNPLRVRPSASAKDFDDPAQLALQQLIAAITTTAGTLSGTNGEVKADQEASDAEVKKTESALIRATEKLTAVDAKIASTKNLVFGKKANAKKDLVDTLEVTLTDLTRQQAELAVRIAELEHDAALFKARQDAVQPIRDAIEGKGDDAGVVAHFKEVRLDIPTWPGTIDTAWVVHATNGPAALEASVQAMQKDVDSLNGLSTTLRKCYDESAKAVFSSGADIRLLNHLDTLISQIGSSRDAIQELMHVLRKDEELVHWSDPNPSVFLFSDTIEPTLSTGKEVTVSVIPLTLDPTENGLKLTEQTPITATFRARRYRALMPEVGVGAVLGYIDRPKYGTATDANGKTIVAQSETDRVSVDPAIMANFVCHCNAGGIAPMLQIGAATSKDLPALLLGGGFRLFGLGKGDIGIGGGLLLGWYKDLQKLKVGSAVSGTADIDADMGYVSTPKTAPYITLQYKF